MRNTPYRLSCVSFFIFLVFHFTAFSQNTQHAIIKTSDQSLKRLPNIEVSINGKPYINVGSKGEALVELEANDIPLKTIRVKDDQYDVASWNYSKGVIEVIIRKKTYKIANVYVQDTEKNTQKNISITFKGARITTATTDNEGKVEIPLALDEKVVSADQFMVPDFTVINLLNGESGSVLTVKRIPVKVVTQEGRKNATEEILIDSIQTLEEFYALFKNYQTQDLTDETRNKLNAKLKQLMKQFEDSVKTTEAQYMVRISDSSEVKEDIRNIISQATIENEQLAQQREQFNDKIRVINQKLARGVLNIDDETRTSLLADITRLEIILESNRSSFYKNQEDYRAILNTIKEKFLNIEDLQQKLSISETQRQEEQEDFQRTLWIILPITILSAVFVVLMIYFSTKLRKQKKELVLANAEKKHVNENLERLVQERTHMLEETNRELDTFLYKASHNLRSPVSSIIGLYNIANHISNPESKELFERAVQTAYAMDRLLRKLKVISEINRTGNFSTFELYPLVNEVRAGFEKRMRDHAIQFEVECPADLTVHSNRNLLDAILYSLMENAIFYTSLKGPSGGKIQLQVQREGAFVNLSVYDNGVGITSNVQGYIYDMFFVGNEQSRGNGLGLYIVQKSVQAINGTVTVESEPNEFTKFVVRIPV